MRDQSLDRQLTIATTTAGTTSATAVAPATVFTVATLRRAAAGAPAARAVRRSVGRVALPVLLAFALALVFVLVVVPGHANAADIEYTNLRGADRFETAIKISNAMFPSGLPSGAGLVLAPGETFPEALCGAPLAAAYGGPVLLTPAIGLNNGVRDEMLRLGPAEVVCVGLSATVVGQVQAAMGVGVTVTAINGSDVYDLSYKVAKALGAEVGDLSGATAIITVGYNFPDAIGVSPLASSNLWPVLLTDSPVGALHQSAIDALTELGISQAIKVGTYSDLPVWLTGRANLSGADRYATNANVAEWSKLYGGLSFSHAALATGDKFPDALAAGPYLGLDGGVLLLSPLSGLPAVIRAELAANDPAVGHVSFIAMIRPVSSQVKALLSDLEFDTTEAMGHLYHLAVTIGPRKGGTPEEWAAAQYGSAYLAGLGYSPYYMDVPLPNGTTSHNVIAVKPGLSPLTILVGGHMDSRLPSPGGNDNASGSATVLELARVLKDATVYPTLIFVLFGQEETVAGAYDDHHWGSRKYVATMTPAQRADLVGMISIDMVGYGQYFYYRTMERGPRAMRDLMQVYATAVGANVSYLKDPSRSGYSDHEPFELSGFPAAWLEWREDPAYHSTGDTYAHCSAACVERAGDFTLGFLQDLDMSDLYNLRAAKW